MDGEISATRHTTRSPLNGVNASRFAFEEGAEHPGHLLVFFHEFGEEVTRAQVVLLIGHRFHIVSQPADDRFMIGQEIRQHLASRWILTRVLPEPRLLKKLAERPQGPSTERTSAFSHFVHNVAQLVVLRFKKLMPFIELRAHNIPVIVSRLGIEQILIGQEPMEKTHDILAASNSQTNVRCHHTLLPSSPFAGLPSHPFPSAESERESSAMRAFRTSVGRIPSAR